MTKERLFTYRITHDKGFAPNPFGGILTLATCKPGMRRTKIEGDWVAGFASKFLAKNTKIETRREIHPDSLIYLMRVTEVLSLDKYFNDPRFQMKKPRSGGYKAQRGDNIYRLKDPDTYEGVGKSDHSNDGTYPQETIATDTGGENALISDEFYYLGRDCTLPKVGTKDEWPSELKLPYGPTCYGIRNDENALKILQEFIKDKGFKVKHAGIPCLQTEEPSSFSKCGGCSS